MSKTQPKALTYDQVQELIDAAVNKALNNQNNLLLEAITALKDSKSAPAPATDEEKLLAIRRAKETPRGLSGWRDLAELEQMDAKNRKFRHRLSLKKVSPFDELHVCGLTFSKFSAKWDEERRENLYSEGTVQLCSAERLNEAFDYANKIFIRAFIARDEKTGVFLGYDEVEKFDMHFEEDEVRMQNLKAEEEFRSEDSPQVYWARMSDLISAKVEISEVEDSQQSLDDQINSVKETLKALEARRT